MIEGAERIVKWKKKLKSLTPHVVFQFLVVKPNEHQIPEARTLAKKIGVDDQILAWKSIDFERVRPSILLFCLNWEPVSCNI